MVYDAGFSRRSSSERELQIVAITSIDPQSRMAVGTTRDRTTLRINCAYATGDTITTPAVGEQWYCERFGNEWRLYGRIPFNDATLNIEPEEGQVSVGSARGPLELNGTEVRANAPVFRLNGAYYRDTGTSLERSGDKVTWVAVGAGGMAGLVQVIAEALASYEGTDQTAAVAALRDWSAFIQGSAENFDAIWNLACGNVFVGGLRRLGVGGTEAERVVDGFQNFANYLFGTLFCDFQGDLTPQTILAQLRDLLAPIASNPFILGLQQVSQALGTGAGNLINDAVSGATGLVELLFDIVFCKWDAARLPQITDVIALVGGGGAFAPAAVVKEVFKVFDFLRGGIFLGVDLFDEDDVFNTAGVATAIVTNLINQATGLLDIDIIPDINLGKITDLALKLTGLAGGGAADIEKFFTNLRKFFGSDLTGGGINFLSGTFDPVSALNTFVTTVLNQATSTLKAGLIPTLDVSKIENLFKALTGQEITGDLSPELTAVKDFFAGLGGGTGLVSQLVSRITGTGTTLAQLQTFFSGFNPLADGGLLSQVVEAITGDGSIFTTGPLKTISDLFAGINTSNSLVNQVTASLGSVASSLDIATTVASITGINLVELTNSYTLTFGGSPTGGNFTLTYGGATTSAITYSTTAETTRANIQAALVALTPIGAGNAIVTVASAVDRVFTASISDTTGTLALGTSSLTGGTSPTLTVVQKFRGPLATLADFFSDFNVFTGANNLLNQVLNAAGSNVKTLVSKITGIAETSFEDATAALANLDSFFDGFEMFNPLALGNSTNTLVNQIVKKVLGGDGSLKSLDDLGSFFTNLRTLFGYTGAGGFAGFNAATAVTGLITQIGNSTTKIAATAISNLGVNQVTNLVKYITGSDTAVADTTLRDFFSGLNDQSTAATTSLASKLSAALTGKTSSTDPLNDIKKFLGITTGFGGLAAFDGTASKSLIGQVVGKVTDTGTTLTDLGTFGKGLRDFLGFNPLGAGDLAVAANLKAAVENFFTKLNGITPTVRLGQDLLQNLDVSKINNLVKAITGQGLSITDAITPGSDLEKVKNFFGGLTGFDGTANTLVQQITKAATGRTGGTLADITKFLGLPDGGTATNGVAAYDGTAAKSLVGQLVGQITGGTGGTLTNLNDLFTNLRAFLGFNPLGATDVVDAISTFLNKINTTAVTTLLNPAKIGTTVGAGVNAVTTTLTTELSNRPVLSTLRTWLTTNTADANAESIQKFFTNLRSVTGLGTTDLTTNVLTGGTLTSAQTALYDVFKNLNTTAQDFISRNLLNGWLKGTGTDLTIDEIGYFFKNLAQLFKIADFKVPPATFLANIGPVAGNFVRDVINQATGNLILPSKITGSTTGTTLANDISARPILTDLTTWLTANGTTGGDIQRTFVNLRKVLGLNTPTTIAALTGTALTGTALTDVQKLLHGVVTTVNSGLLGTDAAKLATQAVADGKAGIDALVRAVTGGNSPNPYTNLANVTDVFTNLKTFLGGTDLLATPAAFASALPGLVTNFAKTIVGGGSARLLNSYLVGVVGAVNGGSFRLAYGTQVTAPITWTTSPATNATTLAASIQSELRLLTGIGTGGATATVNTTATGGSIIGIDVRIDNLTAPLTLSSNSLTVSSGPAAVVSVTQQTDPTFIPLLDVTKVGNLIKLVTGSDTNTTATLQNFFAGLGSGGTLSSNSLLGQIASRITGTTGGIDLASIDDLFANLRAFLGFNPLNSGLNHTNPATALANLTTVVNAFFGKLKLVNIADLTNLLPGNLLQSLDITKVSNLVNYITGQTGTAATAAAVQNFFSGLNGQPAVAAGLASKLSGSLTGKIDSTTPLDDIKNFLGLGAAGTGGVAAFNGTNSLVNQLVGQITNGGTTLTHLSDFGANLRAFLGFNPYGGYTSLTDAVAAFFTKLNSVTPATLLNPAKIGTKLGEVTTTLTTELSNRPVLTSLRNWLTVNDATATEDIQRFFTNLRSVTGLGATTLTGSILTGTTLTTAQDALFGVITGRNDVLNTLITQTGLRGWLGAADLTELGHFFTNLTKLFKIADFKLDPATGFNMGTVAGKFIKDVLNQAVVGTAGALIDPAKILGGATGTTLVNDLTDRLKTVDLTGWLTGTAISTSPDAQKFFHNLRAVLGNPTLTGSILDATAITAARKTIHDFVVSINGTQADTVKWATQTVLNTGLNTKATIDTLVKAITGGTGTYTNLDRITNFFGGFSPYIDGSAATTFINQLAKYITGKTYTTIADAISGLNSFFNRLRRNLNSVFNFEGLNSFFDRDPDTAGPLKFTTSLLPDLDEWKKSMVVVPIVSQLLGGLKITREDLGLGPNEEPGLATLGDIAGRLLTDLTDIPANLLKGILPPNLLGVIPVSQISNTSPNLLSQGSFSNVTNIADADGWSWDSTQNVPGSTGGSAKVTISPAKTRYLYSQQAVPVAVGDRLVVTAAIKTQNLTVSPAGSLPITIALIPFTTPTETNKTGQLADVPIGAARGSTTAWTAIGQDLGNYTVTNAAWKSVIVRLGVASTATGGSVWWDEVSLRKVGELDQGNVNLLKNIWNSLIQGLIKDPTDTLYNQELTGTQEQLDAVASKTDEFRSAFDVENDQANTLRNALLGVTNLSELAALVEASPEKVIRIPGDKILATTSSDDETANLLAAERVDLAIARLDTAVRELTDEKSVDTNPGRNIAVNFSVLPNSATLPSTGSQTWSVNYLSGSSGFGVIGGKASWNTPSSNRVAKVIYRGTGTRTLTVSGPSTGTYTLTVGATTTAAISLTAPATGTDSVQTRITSALGTAGTGTSVTGSSTTTAGISTATYTITLPQPVLGVMSVTPGTNVTAIISDPLDKTLTDYQLMKGTLADPPTLSGNTASAFTAMARVSDDGTSYVYAKAYWAGLGNLRGEIGYAVNNTEFRWQTNIPLTWSTELSFRVGVGDDPRTYQVYSGTKKVTEYTEQLVGGVYLSRMGATNRRFGAIVRQSGGNSSGTISSVSVTDSGASTVSASIARMTRDDSATPQPFPTANTALSNNFFEDEVIKSDIMPDKITGTFTVSKDGAYMVNARIRLSTGADMVGTVNLQVRANDGPRAGTWVTAQRGIPERPFDAGYALGIGAPGAGFALCGNWVQYLTAGSAVRLSTQRTGGSGSILSGGAGGSETYFSIAKL